jgi:hypothetical protein
MWINCVCSVAKLREQTEKVLGSAMKAIMGKTMSEVLKNDEVLEAAIAGLSRVAEKIGSMPADDRARALEAAEHSYQRTAIDLGQNESEAQAWVVTVMARLRAEIEKQASPV